MLMVGVRCNGYLRCSVRWGFRAFLAKDCLPRMSGVLPDSRRALKDFKWHEWRRVNLEGFYCCTLWSVACLIRYNWWCHWAVDSGNDGRNLNSSANEPQQTWQGQVKQSLLYKTACVVMVSDWRLYSSTIRSRRVRLGAFVPESPTAKGSAWHVSGVSGVVLVVVKCVHLS